MYIIYVKVFIVGKIAYSIGLSSAFALFAGFTEQVSSGVAQPGET